MHCYNFCNTLWSQCWLTHCKYWQKPGRGYCWCVWRVSIYIDVSSQYPVQWDCSCLCTWRCRTLYALRGSPACPASLFYSDDLWINIISMKLILFQFLGNFLPKNFLSHNVRKVLSFLMQVTDRSLTIKNTTESSLNCWLIFSMVWWISTLSQGVNRYFLC